MTLSTRRLIYLLAILLFIICAPALVLYTAGYRYDMNKHKLLLTGSLFIKSTPTDAMVYINDELAGTKTPLRINHLTPNRYDIRIEKDGYTTWKKSLEILPKETTFAEHITLWPQSPKSTQILSGSITTFTINPDKTRLLWQVADRVYVYNFFNQETRELIALPTHEQVNFAWSPAENIVIVQQQNDNWVVNVNNFSVSPLVLDSTIQAVRFRDGLPDLLYLITDNGLVQYNLLTKDSTTLQDAQLYDATWWNGQWYYITRTSPPLLSAVGLSEEDPPIFQLPILTDPKLATIANNHALVYEEITQTLYVLNLDPNEFNNTSHILQPVHDWELNRDKQRVLVYNDWEVWEFDLQSKNTTVITRMSKPVQEAHWYADENYISIQLPDQILMVEMDNRDMRNQSTLVSDALFPRHILSSTGESLFTVIVDSATSSRLIEYAITSHTQLGL